MWIRKRIDISDQDLGWAAWRSLWPDDIKSAESELTDLWECPQVLPTLSVRSGFDLLLESSRWNHGDEIIMSGLTIADMPRIAQQHGLVPVGVDIDVDTLSPLVDELEGKINHRTRAILVAHLFGGKCKLDAIAAIAQRHGLMLIEDCAQSWVGLHQTGDPRADVSMFSFGAIKTNTAMGGALIEVRNESLAKRMFEQHQQWPRQLRSAFIRRLLRFMVLTKLSTPRGLSLFARIVGCGNLDSFISQAARGFAGEGFFRRIRKRPSAPLLRLLHRRLSQFDASKIQTRKRRGDVLAKKLACQFPVPGMLAHQQSWWVLAILVDDPVSLVKHMRAAGFDATTASSLQQVGIEDLPNIFQILNHVVFMPFDVNMPDQEMDRMAQTALSSKARGPDWYQCGASEPGFSHPENQSSCK